MNRFAVAFLPLALLVSVSALAQTGSDKVAPTIPETQIKPAELSSDYEFLSVATSADEFIVKAAAIAATNAEAPEVKTLAQELTTAHTALIAASQAAGKADKVDIAAPSEDGEQSGLLGKLQALKGAEFDKAYVESQLFAYQRTISYYRGYADEGNNLAKFAGDTVPELVARYRALLDLAAQVGIGSAAQAPVAQ